ncbi:hypothetical protein ACF0H5_019352 [Mactra antiquata]
MASQVEITAPVSLLRDRLGQRVNKPFTPYPHLQTVVDSERKSSLRGEQDEDDILPFMARTHSPVRVKFTPTTLNKRKSRVSDSTKTAIFNYKPLKRKDNLTTLKFRAPDATLTTLQYLSPWLSVTKTDYKDPRLSSTGDIEVSSIKTEPQVLQQRSNTESVIELSQRGSPVQSRTESQLKSELASRDCSRINSSKSTEKRVTILEPSEMSDLNRLKTRMASPPRSYKSKTMDIREPEGSVNFYSGYLPPEYSEKIAEQLNIGEKSDESQTERDEKVNHPNISSQYYKPLVGDRSLYKRSTYPVQPKLILSDIYQLRLEDRKRILNNHGQAPVHFSAFKDRGTLAVPKQKGAAWDEAVRVQQREQKGGMSNAQNSKFSRQPAKNSSVEQFQLQRERTYHLQNLAREMINK